MGSVVTIAALIITIASAYWGIWGWFGHWVQAKYREGEAILFDGSATIHRTQSYNADKEDKRILVYWQFGTTREEMQTVLSRIGKRNGDPMFFHAHEIL